MVNPQRLNIIPFTPYAITYGEMLLHLTNCDPPSPKGTNVIKYECNHFNPITLLKFYYIYHDYCTKTIFIIFISTHYQFLKWVFWDFKYSWSNLLFLLCRDSDTLRRPKKSSSTGQVALRYFNRFLFSVHNIRCRSKHNIVYDRTVILNR